MWPNEPVKTTTCPGRARSVAWDVDRRYAYRMAEALTSEPIPLVSGADGVIRVRGTRVTLETLLAAFADGATAEEIAQQYPSISLADAYQVIGYYLRHTSELEHYLARRCQE